MIAGTLQTDPRSGGIKRSSDVNVLPIVSETWVQVRDNADSTVDWLIAGYDGTSKTDITILEKGNGGIDECSKLLPENLAVFGGCRLTSNGRFVTFFYADDGTPTMQRGRASMHKNGVLNVLEGSDGEIEMYRNLTEDATALPVSGDRAHLKSNAPKEGERARVVKKVPHIPEKQEMAVETTVGSVPKTNTHDPKSTYTLEGTTIPYQQLKDMKDLSSLPDGIDPTKRELALPDTEFEVVFGMDKASFQKLPGWKRTNMKKAKGLF